MSHRPVERRRERRDSRGLDVAATWDANVRALKRIFVGRVHNEVTEDEVRESARQGVDTLIFLEGQKRNTFSQRELHDYLSKVNAEREMLGLQQDTSSLFVRADIVYGKH